MPTKEEKHDEEEGQWKKEKGKEKGKKESVVKESIRIHCRRREEEMRMFRGRGEEGTGENKMNLIFMSIHYNTKLSYLLESYVCVCFCQLKFISFSRFLLG